MEELAIAVPERPEEAESHGERAEERQDEAMKAADVAGFPTRKAEAAQRGKLRGLGYAAYIEACGIAPSNIAGALGARAGLFEAGTVASSDGNGVTRWAESVATRRVGRVSALSSEVSISVGLASETTRQTRSMSHSVSSFT